jgi:DNA-nicking Smr family endonuclease
MGYEDPPKMLLEREEGFFQICIGAEMLNKLDGKFSDTNTKFPRGTETVIEIPISLGRQLYAACIESVFTQEEINDEIITELSKKHEDFKSKLIEGLEINNGSINAFTLENSSEEDSDTNADFLSLDGINVTDSVKSYRHQVHTYLTQHDKFFKKAETCLKANKRNAANNYFEKAHEQLQLYKEAKNLLFEILTEKCSKNQNILDLHGFLVKEAIRVLDNFLDDNIINLQSEMLDTKSLMVITGRGIHSRNGIPKIKPAVQKRLQERRLKYSEGNPGFLKVKITLYSYLSEDLDDVF